MRIGVIGAGHIGMATSRLFADAGHEVMIANSRGPETLAGEVEDDVTPGTVEEVAEFGEIVLLAIPLKAYATLPADELADTIVIDATNYYPSRDGNIEELDGDAITSTELIARHLYGSRMVKAFNTLAADTLEDEGGRAAGDHSRLVLFVAADDESAKTEVMDLIDEIGFDPFDIGALAEGGRALQPDSSLYGQELTNVQAREALGLHIRGVND